MNDINLSVQIGVYHPQKMNRIAYTQVLDGRVRSRVTPIENIFDIFSAQYHIVILIEPEIVESEQKTELINSFVNTAKKPILIIPFHERQRSKYNKNVTIFKCNPVEDELINMIKKIEKELEESKVE